MKRKSVTKGSLYKGLLRFFEKIAVLLGKWDAVDVVPYKPEAR